MSEPADPSPASGPAAKDVDIGALLTVALGAPPPERFADKVGAKLTMMTTVTDMALLLFAAPFSWLRAEEPPPPKSPASNESA